MRYFANPSTERVRNLMSDGTLGCIITPAQGNKVPDGAVYCADNGSFGKGYPGDVAWWAWLQRKVIDNGADGCAFAVAPDVVGDAAATLDRSLPWLPKIRALGIPAALVAQNGLERLPVPWDVLDVLFIGGCVECRNHGPQPGAIRVGRGARQRSYCAECEADITGTDWKLGAHARRLVSEARRLGKAVHMGRVNSGGRFRYAEAIGCDSADGTTLAQYPDATLPDVLAWLRPRPQATLALDFGAVR